MFIGDLVLQTREEGTLRSIVRKLLFSGGIFGGLFSGGGVVRLGGFVCASVSAGDVSAFRLRDLGTAPSGVDSRYSLRQKVVSRNEMKC